MNKICLSQIKPMEYYIGTESWRWKSLELNRKIERERIEKMSNQDIINHVDNSIEEIQKAIEAEREACATICEQLPLPEWPNKIRQPLAQAIRARGHEK